MSHGLLFVLDWALGRSYSAALAAAWSYLLGLLGLFLGWLRTLGSLVTGHGFPFVHVHDQLQRMLDHAAAAGTSAALPSVPPLPPAVQRYLQRYAQPSLPARVVSMQLEGWVVIGGNFQKLSLRGWYSTSSPGFVISCKVQLSRLTWLSGVVSLIGGHGSAVWRQQSLFSTSKATAEHSLPQPALSQFLLLAPCFPAALLPSSFVSWRAAEGSASCAEAVMQHGAGAARALVQFDGDTGQIISMRPAPTSSTSRPSIWHYSIGMQQQPVEIAGSVGKGELKLPTHLEAAWEVDGSTVTFLHLDVMQWSAMQELHAR